MLESPWWLAGILTPVMIGIAALGKLFIDYIQKEHARSIAVTDLFIEYLKLQTTSLTAEQTKWQIILAEHNTTSLHILESSRQHQATQEKMIHMLEGMMEIIDLEREIVQNGRTKGNV